MTCVRAVVMVKEGALNGVMDRFPSRPEYGWSLPTFTGLADIVNPVVSAINSIGCLPVATSRPTLHRAYYTLT